MKLTKFFLITLHLLGTWAPGLAKKTASIKAYGLQVSLDIGSTSFGDYLYFTTYDGKTNYPLNDSNLVSGELKAFNSQSTTYVTDYLVSGYNGVNEHGSVSISIPLKDGDSNGVPDWLQKNLSANENVTGLTNVHYLAPGAYSTNATLTGKFTRSAGYSNGSYALNYFLPGLGSATAKGTWYVGYYEGKIEYSDSTYAINATTIDSKGNEIAAAGSSTYSFSNSEILNLGQINLNLDGEMIQLSINSLDRNGNTYSGFAEALDGNPATSWADFTDWFIEVTDTNDEDLDGIPDLTDPTQKNNQSTKVDLDGWNWYRWPWVYNQSSKSWFYYYSNLVWSNHHQMWFSWDDTTGIWLSQN
jgi:hypothetical protein